MEGVLQWISIGIKSARCSRQEKNLEKDMGNVMCENRCRDCQLYRFDPPDNRTRGYCIRGKEKSLRKGNRSSVDVLHLRPGGIKACSKYIDKDILDEMYFGKKIQTLRREQGLSKSDLAKKAGYDKSTITHIESGDRAGNINTLRDILGALGYVLILRKVGENGYE